MLCQIAHSVYLIDFGMVHLSYLAQLVQQRIVCRFIYHVNVPSEVCPQFDVKIGGCWTRCCLLPGPTMWFGCSNTDPPEIALQRALIALLYTLKDRSTNYCRPSVTSPRIDILKETTFILFDCTYKRHVVGLSTSCLEGVKGHWRCNSMHPYLRHL